MKNSHFILIYSEIISPKNRQISPKTRQLILNTEPIVRVVLHLAMSRKTEKSYTFRYTV